MKSILLAILLGVPMPARSADTDAAILNGEDIDLENSRIEVESERTVTKRIFEQEKNEIGSIQTNKKLSAKERSVAIKKIRKEYLEKRNAERIRRRMELRKRMQINGKGSEK
jgi:hypothetical protein